MTPLGLKAHVLCESLSKKSKNKHYFLQNFWIDLFIYNKYILIISLHITIFIKFCYNIHYLL